MLTEYILQRMGWDSIWYAHPGPGGLRRLWRMRVFWPGRFHVGVWTGPQLDLLCIERCDTNEEAERALSPSGPTVLLATLAALWKAYWLRR